MPEWLIWMAAFWFFFAVTGRRSCGRGANRLRDRGATSRPAVPRADRPGARTFPRSAPAPPVETAEARLQREFVEGRLTMEEYEAALWREIGPGVSSGPRDRAKR